MANQRGVRCVRLALIQQGLKPPGGSIEEEGFDSVGHILFYHSPQQSALIVQPRSFNRNGREGRRGNGVKIVNSFAYFAPLAVKSIFALLRASVSPMNNVYSKVVLAGFRQPG